jgi:Tfp pilus assembly protein PilW
MRPAGEHGFTLVETLVTLVMGVIVTGALFAILEVTVHQSSRVNDRAQATQLGRVTMTKMVNELHSACIAPKFSPVQEKSGESALIFRAAVGSEAVLQKEKAAQHEIIFTAAKGGVPGTLVDKTYAGNGGEWPNFTYASTASTVKIGEYIYPTPKPVPPPASEPVFKYFKYSLTTPAASSSTPVSQLEEIVLKPAETLTAAQAQTVAAVQITFTAGAVDGNTALNRSAEMSNLVNFSFTVPTAETPIEASPCE